MSKEKEIIAINLDTSSDNNSDSGNNTSDSSSTSQISTSEEIDYDSLEYKGPPKTQASHASSKAKVQACGSKAKLQTSRSKAKLQRSPKTLVVKSPIPITNCVLGLANAETWDAILSKTFRVKIPQLWLVQKRRKGRGRLTRESDFNFLYDRKGPSKANVHIFEGPSVQGLLDYYRYNDIEEYLARNYFPSTDKENTDKDIRDKDTTDEDCIHKCNYAMSKGKGEKKGVIWKFVMLFVCIFNLQLAFASKHLQLAFASKHLQLAFASKHLQLVFASKHLQLAFAACICSLHLQASIRSLHLQARIRSLHLQLAFATCICILHLHLAFAACICILHLQLVFASCTRSLHLQLAFASKHLQ
ncbi:hypothetical protein Tco_1308349, partial [Tanacetum coccineum]